MEFRKNRVLIVEDDPACETILRHIVRSVDSAAVIDSADNAEAATLKLVQELEGRGQPYDLVIADVFLAGKLTGLDLWRIYGEFCPAPPVVLTSSLPFPRLLGATAADENVPSFLPKPFYAEECRRIIRRFVASA
jgi:response regulator of citrate/malate metabolism